MIKISQLKQGKELDKLIAQEIFDRPANVKVKGYSTNIKHAIDLVDSILSPNCSFDLYISYDSRFGFKENGYYSACALFRDGESNTIGQSRDKTIPLAICKAALKMMLKHYRDNGIKTDLEE